MAEGESHESTVRMPWLRIARARNKHRLLALNYVNLQNLETQVNKAADGFLVTISCGMTAG